MWTLCPVPSGTSRVTPVNPRDSYDGNLVKARKAPGCSRSLSSMICVLVLPSISSGTPEHRVEPKIGLAIDFCIHVKFGYVVLKIHCVYVCYCLFIYEYNKSFSKRKTFLKIFFHLKSEYFPCLCFQSHLSLNLALISKSS